MKISIIIPTYNEEENISDLLAHLQTHSPDDTEIIVVDGGSDDRTVARAKEFDINCMLSTKKGRAAQMNAGAEIAGGDILYFVHADSRPPKTFPADIRQSIDQGYPAGCYRFEFDSEHPLLKINSYCTRFDLLMCRGGDQTLYITRKLFDELGGYKDYYIIMEDFDMIERIQERTYFRIIPKSVTVSSRKYTQNNYFKVQIANFIVFMMYYFDYSQEAMVNTYKRLLYHPKF